MQDDFLVVRTQTSLVLGKAHMMVGSYCDILRNLWCLIFIINLPGFTVTEEAHFWLSMRAFLQGRKSHLVKAGLIN